MEFVLDFRQRDDARQGLLACFQEVLGHQLPNRLVAVQGLARLLEEENSTDEERALVGRIATLAEETHRLVVTIAEIGRLCRDACSAPTPNPAEAAREAGATLAVLSPGAIVEYDFPERLPAVIASQPSLSRVLVELLRNAAQANRSPAAPIDVGGRATADAVELWVADRGRGLPEGALERFLEPFQRGGLSSGPGLGLFLVRQVIACWRGALLVHSEPHSGSRFTVRIPRLPAETSRKR
jgi:two-component system sensor histidine kinase KdpD